MNKLVPLLLVFALARIAGAGEEPPGEPSDYRALTEYCVLRDTYLLDWDIDPDRPLQKAVVAWRLILARSDATQVFTSLFAEAKPAGKFYALCGLWVSDSKVFARLAPSLIESKESVRLTRGCSHSGGLEEAVGSLVSNPQAVRLRGPQDSLAALRARDPQARGTKEILDVVGGGIPDVLRASSFGSNRKGIEALPADQREVGVWVQRLATLGKGSADLEDLLFEGDKDLEPILAGLRCFGPAVAPHLSALLKHASLGVRLRALQALGYLRVDSLGQAVHTLAPALAELTGDSNPQVSSMAVSVLRRQGPWAGAATPGLLAVLARVVAEPSSEAQEGLEERGLEVVGVLAEIRPPRIDALKGLLRHANSEIVLTAAGALSDLGPRAAPTVSEFVRLLGSKDGEVRSYAALRLGSMDDDERLPASAITALVGCLNDPEEEVRARVAEALGDIGPRAREALPRLRALLRDPEPRARICACVALWNVGQETVGLPLLAELAVRGRLFEGESEESSRRLTKSAESGLQSFAREAKGREALLAYGTNRSSADPAAAQALRAIGSGGVEGKSLAARLRQVVAEDFGDGVRVAAAESLFDLTGNCDEALRLHRERLRGDDPSLASESGWAVQRYEKRAQEALAEVLVAFKRFPADLAEPLTHFCRDLGPAATSAIPALVSCLEHGEEADQLRSCAALASMGKLARKALPALRRLAKLKGPDSWVAYKAQEAAAAISK